MYILLMIIHIIACFVLIGVILLQAGRGGGLSEAFGGEAAQSVLGTQAPVILKKATTFSAVAFLLTSLLLGVITARSGKSLFERGGFPVMPQQGTAPVVPAEVPVGETAPVTEQAPQPEEAQPVGEQQ